MTDTKQVRATTTPTTPQALVGLWVLDDTGQVIFVDGARRVWGGMEIAGQTGDRNHVAFRITDRVSLATDDEIDVWTARVEDHVTKTLVSSRPTAIWVSVLIPSVSVVLLNFQSIDISTTTHLSLIGLGFGIGWWLDLRAQRAAAVAARTIVAGDFRIGPMITKD